MKCPFCDATLTHEDSCERCGEDIRNFIKIYRISNRCYNEGLKKAKIRDLSGAISELRNSLKYNKKNTKARNLLGLIYSEVGDTTLALSEWVISTHFQAEENDAEKYLSYYQMNPTRLDNANKIIKKFNSAIKATRNESEDLAIIQCKKVISINPHHLKALQLLGLLYIKAKQYENAKKYLDKAIKIDISNPITLLYLNELKENGIADSMSPPVKSERVLFADSDSFAPASYYKEDKPSVLPWINLVLGIILGSAFFAIAMLPGIQAKSVEGKKAEIVALNENLSEANADINQLKGENAELQRKLDELTKKNKNLLENPVIKKDEEGQTSLENLVNAANFYIMAEERQAAESLMKIDREKIENSEAVNLYNQLSGKLFEKESNDLFVEGRDLYNKGRFDEGLEKLELSLKMNPLNVDSMYFLGRTFDRKADVEKAKEWYEKVMKEFPNTGRANEAKQRLRRLGGS